MTGSRTMLGVRVWLVATATALAGASHAAADTSQSSARAATVTVGASSASTGWTTAANPGGEPDDVQSQSVTAATLGSQPLVTAGLLAQVARADSGGSSAACAALVGAGGSLSVAANGACTVIAGSSGGVVLTLVPAAGLVPATTLRANAIVAECTAVSDGSTSTRVRLVGAGIYVGSLLTTTLTAEPAAGTAVTVPGVATLGLHTTSTPNGAGSVGATALTVALTSGTVSAVLGQVTCGANALTPPTPAVPVEGLPTAILVLALLAMLVGPAVRRQVVAGLASVRGVSPGAAP